MFGIGHATARPGRTGGRGQNAETREAAGRRPTRLSPPSCDEAPDIARILGIATVNECGRRTEGSRTFLIRDAAARARAKPATWRRWRAGSRDRR